VATHRHGCCVLQRCIDHASEAQKVLQLQETTMRVSSSVRSCLIATHRVVRPLSCSCNS
jgi:hypothetical protein